MTEGQGRSDTARVWFLIIFLAILVVVWLSIQDTGNHQDTKAITTRSESAPSRVPATTTRVVPDNRGTENLIGPPSPTPVLPTPYPIPSPYPAAQPTSAFDSYPLPDSSAPNPYPAPAGYP